eukprot:TRINITY_DN1309_c0_g1_i2.p1 TRINITY_DN1309_c0_g1~~TRINITY_DN1309_c0_g1_i2.p1  ORF type:complete len:232 (-),score=66.06 TRINITY_DN1309_c0_g1_i2:98-793(-)
MTVHDVLVETFPQQISSIDETVLKYIEEVLADSAEMPTETLQDTLSGLFISLNLASSDSEAHSILKTIASKLNIKDTSNAEEFKTLKSPIQLQQEKTKAEPNYVEDFGMFQTYDVVDGKKIDDYPTPEEVIEQTRNPDPKKRKAALREMCPCHVKANIPALWERIIEMANDPDPVVRYQVMHNLCDGSPACREDDVIRTLESMHNDEDKAVRRKVHQILTHYRHTGKWNVM